MTMLLLSFQIATAKSSSVIYRIHMFVGVYSRDNRIF